MQHVKHANVKIFFKQCGSDADWFRKSDGSIDVGYRLNRRMYGGWEFLDVSLCHIYYGK